MIKSFLNAVENAKIQVSDINFMLKSRTKDTYFTRDSAKMSFTNAIYLVLKSEKNNPEVFIELNNNFINWFYDDGNFKKYKGFRLLAIDGSITEVPNTEKTREYFGYYNNQSQRKLARAMFGIIYDIENGTILESKISNWKEAERDTAKELIERLEKKGFHNDLIIFDRGYTSKAFISFLEKKKLK